jgi:16S rRNA (adenine1518-N6/adenine1519-N6)-dimethyltransferase
MSLEETKQLLRAHRISPNKLMGQNFMVELSLYQKLCAYAEISKEDVVLDAGAGFGWLTCFLADKCKSVVAVEKDPHIAMILGEQVKNLDNVTVVEGDVLKAVMILQKEFANRLVASCGSEEYGWLTVVTNQGAAVELLDSVSKVMFYPQPEVDSVIVSLKLWRTKPFEVKDQVFFIRMIKWLFTQRNKKLGKAIAPFIRNSYKLSKQDAEIFSLGLPSSDRRVRELSLDDFGALSNAFSK